MKSMTGYGSAEHRDESLQLTVEIKSYNNRFLDLSFYLPSYLGSLEPSLREYLGDRISRGKVEASVRITEFQDPSEITVDEGLARRYVCGLEELRAICGSEEPIRLEHVAGLEGIFRARRERDAESYADMVESALGRAFEVFETSRIREGARTKEDVLLHMGTIGKELERVAAFSPRIRETVLENLRSRFTELLGDGIDESRVMSEAALLLVKFDVNEEIQRLRSHLQAFADIAAGGEPCGKKLDFICQELNREVNTLGSKNILLEVDASIISMKDGVEKIREQLRNVE